MENWEGRPTNPRPRGQYMGSPPLRPGADLRLILPIDRRCSGKRGVRNPIGVLDSKGIIGTAASQHLKWAVTGRLADRRSAQQHPAVLRDDM